MSNEDLNIFESALRVGFTQTSDWFVNDQYSKLKFVLDVTVVDAPPTSLILQFQIEDPDAAAGMFAFRQFGAVGSTVSTTFFSIGAGFGALMEQESAGTAFAHDLPLCRWRVVMVQLVTDAESTWSLRGRYLR